MEVVITDRAAQARRELTPRLAAVVIACAWLPAVVLAAFLPRYVPVFDRWPAAWGELPALTHVLMAVGRLGVWPIALAAVGLVAVLAGGGAGWVRAGLPGRRAVALAFAAAGLGALAVFMAGALGPLLTARVAR